MPNVLLPLLLILGLLLEPLPVVRPPARPLPLLMPPLLLAVRLLALPLLLALMRTTALLLLLHPLLRRLLHLSRSQLEPSCEHSAVGAKLAERTLLTIRTEL